MAGAYAEGQGVLSRNLLTDTGRVFFETAEALAPSDTNGVLDVYEYEGGHVYLISSGTSSFESNLEGASESGNDVFFRSNQQLVPQDNQPGQIVIYDARVAGGFPAPPRPRRARPPTPAARRSRHSPRFTGRRRARRSPASATSRRPQPTAKTKSKPVKCKGDGSRRSEKKGKCVRKPAKKAKKSAHANRRGK